MNRSAIPAAIRRSILVEAGHRCAIPTCKYPSVEVHHIIPWEIYKKHDYENLIALCPNCHKRADAGEIDRKALRMYKARLNSGAGVKKPEIVKKSEIMKLSESRKGKPGYEFEFEYPVFDDSKLQTAISAFILPIAYKHLYEMRKDFFLYKPDYEYALSDLPNTISAAFKIIRNDSLIMSIKYRISWYGSGAAHSNSYTKVINIYKKPFFQIELYDLFSMSKDCLAFISDYCIDSLRTQIGNNMFEDGAGRDADNFKNFNITDSGVLFTFDEYQVACAAGPQRVEAPYGALQLWLNRKLKNIF